MIDKERIKNKTKEILNTNIRPPVDPLAISKAYGIDVKNAVFDDDSLSGMIAKRKGKAVILVNINDSVFRKRFTIAHELGHFLLHLDNDGEFADYNTDLFRNNEGSSDEVEANFFAANLLMPEDLIKAEWNKHMDIDQMTKSFMVSKEAMAIRLSTMKLL